MNVIFLDIDGVLNSENYVKKCGDAWTGDQLDPEAIARLNKLTTLGNASIVVSSSWRIIPGGVMSSHDMASLLNQHGVVAPIIGVTPYLDSDRAIEIDFWLQDHPEVKNFVILDDDRLEAKCDSEDPYLNDRFVRTTWWTGLQDQHVERALKILEAIL